MSLISELTKQLNSNWTYREFGDDIEVYCGGTYLMNLRQEKNADDSYCLPDLKRLRECAYFIHPHIRKEIREELISAKMRNVMLMPKWFRDRTFNTYEMNAALTMADPAVIATRLRESLKQVQPCTGEPTTYEEAIIHVLAKRAADLLCPIIESN